VEQNPITTSVVAEGVIWHRRMYLYIQEDNMLSCRTSTRSFIL